MLIKNFEGSETKFRNWCKKAYLGQRGPKGADQVKYDKAITYFENNHNKSIQESFQPESLLKMDFNAILKANGGNFEQTLNELNELMSSLQGSNDTKERQAYFKARKFYGELVSHINKQNEKEK